MDGREREVVWPALNRMWIGSEEEESWKEEDVEGWIYTRRTENEVTDAKRFSVCLIHI